jgi:cadmium resistance protein CadD (predicted permease)
MKPLLGILAASATTFAATNVDDLLLLAFFFARRIPTGRVVAGQYLGFLGIVTLSLCGVWLALGIPHSWIRLLGIIPMAIGIRHFLRTRTSEPERHLRQSMGVLPIALVTLANGADNVGIYVPFFTITRTYLWLILTVYFAFVPIWCMAGKIVGNHRLAVGVVERYGHWLVPAVFMAMGIYILLGR